MSFKITDDCIACGVCVTECPNAAIIEDDPIFVINPDLCSECIPAHDTSQCAEVCPTDACIPDDDHVESREELEAKYAQIHS